MPGNLVVLEHRVLAPEDVDRVAVQPRGRVAHRVALDQRRERSADSHRVLADVVERVAAHHHAREAQFASHCRIARVRRIVGPGVDAGVVHVLDLAVFDHDAVETGGALGPPHLDRDAAGGLGDRVRAELALDVVHVKPGEPDPAQRAARGSAARTSTPRRKPGSAASLVNSRLRTSQIFLVVEQQGGFGAVAVDGGRGALAVAVEHDRLSRGARPRGFSMPVQEDPERSRMRSPG